jgi:hypothetical protein
MSFLSIAKGPDNSQSQKNETAARQPRMQRNARGAIPQEFIAEARSDIGPNQCHQSLLSATAIETPAPVTRMTTVEPESGQDPRGCHASPYKRVYRWVDVNVYRKASRYV